MAIIKCPECGKKISDKAEACPNCGAPLTSTVKQRSAQQPQKEKLYKRTGFTVFMLLFVYPIGAVLMWMYRKNWKTSVKVIITAACVIVALSSTFGSIDDSKNEAQATSEIEDNEEEKQENQEEDTETVSLGSELEQFQSGGYAYITNSDLNTYAVNMSGVKVYVVTQVDDMKDGKIQSILDNGFMMSNFNVGDNYEKYSEFIAEDDMVAIAGTVADMTDYSFAGKSVEVNDCIVFAVGDDADQYVKDSTDESLSQYLTVTEDVADTEDDISEEDYKDLCQQLNYEDILRNPDTYDGEYCVVSGTVDQIIEGWFDTYTIYVMDTSGNKWECSYLYKDGESHLLEGDSVTVYGKCNGTTTANTLMGEQVTLPYVDAEYIN